ncbi:MAG: hypothetical protein M3M89_02735 [Thermoproteota archaeon]|nr:hypothetical protein [Thermoproteota archaeon]
MKLGDIELFAIRIQYLDDISQSEPAELTKCEIIGLLCLTKHLTLHSKVKADLEFESKAVENYINLAKNH